MKSAVVLVLALAACAHSAPPTTAEQGCAAHIDDDPAVKQNIANSAEPDWLWQNEGKLEIVKQQAMARCLQSRGSHIGGGVERSR